MFFSEKLARALKIKDGKEYKIKMGGKTYKLTADYNIGITRFYGTSGYLKKDGTFSKLIDTDDEDFFYEQIDVIDEDLNLESIFFESDDTGTERIRPNVPEEIFKKEHVLNKIYKEARRIVDDKKFEESIEFKFALIAIYLTLFDNFPYHGYDKSNYEITKLIGAEEFKKTIELIVYGDRKFEDDMFSLFLECVNENLFKYIPYNEHNIIYVAINEKELIIAALKSFFEFTFITQKNETLFD